MKFRNDADRAFLTVVRARVNAYFEENGISRYGNRTMLLKAIVLVSVRPAVSRVELPGGDPVPFPVPVADGGRAGASPDQRPW
jgi:hypothetical protein